MFDGIALIDLTSLAEQYSAGRYYDRSVPQVWNRHHRNAPPAAVYIGRGTKWGNPFIRPRDGDSREAVVAQYDRWLCAQPFLIAQLFELRGRHLLCSCAPKLCHGHVLLWYANDFKILNYKARLLYEEKDEGFLMNAPSNFSDLTFDRMITLPSERDRTTTMSFGVFRGRASIAVFSGQGGPPKAKLSLPRYFHTYFKLGFGGIPKAPDKKVSLPIQEWDPNAKKLVVMGSITLGYDAHTKPYIGLMAPGLEPTKFPLRPDLKWDTSTAAEINGDDLAVEGFLHELDQLYTAIYLSRFKFDPAQARGGNRAIGGSRPAATTEKSDDVSDDYIPF